MLKRKCANSGIIVMDNEQPAVNNNSTRTDRLTLINNILATAIKDCKEPIKQDITVAQNIFMNTRAIISQYQNQCLTEYQHGETTFNNKANPASQITKHDLKTAKHEITEVESINELLDFIQHQVLYNCLSYLNKINQNLAGVNGWNEVKDLMLTTHTYFLNAQKIKHYTPALSSDAKLEVLDHTLFIKHLKNFASNLRVASKENNPAKRLAKQALLQANLQALQHETEAIKKYYTLISQLNSLQALLDRKSFSCIDNQDINQLHIIKSTQVFIAKTKAYFNDTRSTKLAEMDQVMATISLVKDAVNNPSQSLAEQLHTQAKKLTGSKNFKKQVAAALMVLAGVIVIAVSLSLGVPAPFAVAPGALLIATGAGTLFSGRQKGVAKATDKLAITVDKYTPSNSR